MSSHSSAFYRRTAAVAAAMLATFVLAACGGDDKPAFCADRSSFEDSVNQIPTMVTDGNISGLQSQIDTIESNANTLVDSARSDFPSESDQVKSSVESLRKAYDALPKDPSATQVAAFGLQAASTIGAVKSFVSATNSACD